MAVRAKFRVDMISRQVGWNTQHPELQTIKLSAVTGTKDGTDENSKFWAATPQGHIEVACVNPEAVAEFKLGGFVYVDFTPAD